MPGKTDDSVSSHCSPHNHRTESPLCQTSAGFTFAKSHYERSETVLRRARCGPGARRGARPSLHPMPVVSTAIEGRSQVERRVDLSLRVKGASHPWITLTQSQIHLKTTQEPYGNIEHMMLISRPPQQLKFTDSLASPAFVLSTAMFAASLVARSSSWA